MPRRGANQKFTVWKIDGIDLNGQPSYLPPVTILGRIERKGSLFLNGDGRETRGDSTIYTEDSGARLADIIFVGESLSTTPEKGSKEIQDIQIISNLAGTRTEYKIII